MASVSISTSGTTKTISGGSSGDRVTLADVVASVTSGTSGLTALYNNVAYQTTAAALDFDWNTSAFSDLTGGDLWFENSSNNQLIGFQLGGDCVIGNADDGEPRDFVVHLGDSDLANTHLETSAIDLLDHTDQIVMQNGARYVVYHHLVHGSSAASGEPASRNPTRIKNNNSGSSIAITMYGGAMANDTAWTLPNTGSAKPNGTMLYYWEVTSAVAVRDVEYYDGFVDWRPFGTWSPPTRGVFISETWIKFLGNETFTFAAPLIFGNEDDAFVLKLDQSGEATSSVWWQHGLRPITDVAGRIVYNNMSGVDWSADMAVFNLNTSGRDIHIEHHITLPFKLIDQLEADISGGEVQFTARDPSYTTSTTTADVTFPGGNEKVIKATSIGDGTGKIGNDGADLSSDALCIEAFQKVGDNTGFDVDGNYHSIASARADYDSFTTCTYSIYKWGKLIIFGTSYTPALSGDAGDGLQEIGVVQMSTDDTVTAATIGAVGTGLAALTLDEVYDRLTKHSFDNDLDHWALGANGAIDFGALNIDFDDGHSVDIAESGGLIDIRVSDLNVGTKLTSIATTGTVTFNGGVDFDNLTIGAETTLTEETDLTNVVITGNNDIHVATALGSSLAWESVDVQGTGRVVNDSAGNTLTITKTGTGQLIADNPGPGNGQTLIVENVDLEINGLTEGSRGIMIGSGGAEDGNTLLAGYANASGVVSGTFGGTTPQSVVAEARNGGSIAACIQDDGGVFTDFTAEARDRGTPNDCDFLPAAPATSDAAYFAGIDPFGELRINVTTAGATYVGTWEYWNGAWVALTTTDGTSSFQSSGVGLVEFTAPGDWATTTVNSQGAFYYIRFRVTTGGGTGPQVETITLNKTIKYLPFNPEQAVSGTIQSGSGLAVTAVWVEDLNNP